MGEPGSSTTRMSSVPVSSRLTAFTVNVTGTPTRTPMTLGSFGFVTGVSETWRYCGVVSNAAACKSHRHLLTIPIGTSLDGAWGERAL